MAGRTVPLNIAFRVRVSVVCIQCEHTQRKKNKTKIIMFSQINAQGKKGWGVTTSQGGWVGGGGRCGGGGGWEGVSLEEIRTLTQINLKNMVLQHCTGKWELNG